MRFKRKKIVRMRGTKRHGWGILKHRGAGNRGGRGASGTGKRADQKKTLILKLYGPEYFGKHGFKRATTIKQKGVNLAWLEIKANDLAEKKLITKQNDIFAADLGNLGFSKLLSTGKLSKKFNITTDYASEKAISKVEEAGGKVTVRKGKAIKKEA